jgi:Fe(3+) dicitrate transport protein
MKSRWILYILLSAINNVVVAQNIPDQDSAHIKYLAEITLVGRANRSDLQQIPEIVGTAIYAGKKSSLLVMKNVEGNITTNVMRQVMAKIPGIHIWENDGSGIQIGIATRGLSPNRSWEFNVRQNGYDIAADPYGYPEAYYNPQLQAVQRIEIIRGHGALQYGPQFGGMVNYILRDGSEFKKSFQVETQQTIGTYMLVLEDEPVSGITLLFLIVDKPMDIELIVNTTPMLVLLQLRIVLQKRLPPQWSICVPISEVSNLVD